jgi:hypothetical protein
MQAVNVALSRAFVLSMQCWQRHSGLGQAFRPALLMAILDLVVDFWSLTWL